GLEGHGAGMKKLAGVIQRHDDHDEPPPSVDGRHARFRAGTGSHVHQCSMLRRWKNHFNLPGVEFNMSRKKPRGKRARRGISLQGRFRRFFSDLGPGLITGAADDDPSGISTYSVTGAGFGYTP